jgi:hypothetical protein
VTKWKFKPGRKGGADVLTHMQVPIVFTVEGSNQAPEKAKAAAPSPESASSETPVFKLSEFNVVSAPATGGPTPAAPAGK